MTTQGAIACSPAPAPSWGTAVARALWSLPIVGLIFAPPAAAVLNLGVVYAFGWEDTAFRSIDDDATMFELQLGFSLMIGLFSSLIVGVPVTVFLARQRAGALAFLELGALFGLAVALVLGFFDLYFALIGIVFGATYGLLFWLSSEKILSRWF